MKLITIFLVSFVTHGFAADDCTLDIDAIKGVLDRSSKDIKTFHPGKIHDRSFSESMLMKKGWKVTYETGGCAHIGLSFTYEDFALKPLIEKSVIIETATKLLNETPTLNATNLSILKNALIEAKTSNDKLVDKQLRLPCGDANCAVEISEKNKLKISYDFAL